MEFPLTFTKCPNPKCKNQSGVAERVADDEKKKGRMGADGKAAIQVLEVVIADSRRAVLMVPVITALVDACPKCGTLFAVHIDQRMAPVGMPGAKV